MSNSDNFLKCMNYLFDNNQTISLSESCTGGLIAGKITSLSGASKIFKISYITYSNEAKINLLAVNPYTLSVNGAVSKETVEEMLLGTLSESGADFSGAVSGIAGPNGGSKEKPVGTIFIGVASRDGNMLIEEYFFEGDREKIRKSTVSAFFDLFFKFIQSLK